ncbi:MAG: hypothetical protein ACEPOW_02020 [Bacteroidales bacterium]
MEDIKFLISGIEYKIAKLLQIQRDVIAELDVVRSENRQLREELLKKNENIQNLQEEINNIKFARAKESGNETREMKKKIDLLIQDLDKCISFLEN